MREREREREGEREGGKGRRKGRQAGKSYSGHCYNAIFTSIPPLELIFLKLI